jgi:hypothetical protein
VTAGFFDKGSTQIRAALVSPGTDSRKIDAKEISPGILLLSLPEERESSPLAKFQAPPRHHPSDPDVANAMKTPVSVKAFEMGSFNLLKTG